MNLDVKYENTAYFKAKWNVTRSKISQWYKAGRLEGAIKPYRDILIPNDTERPKPLKSGRPTK